MNQQWNRRDVLKGLVVAPPTLVIPREKEAALESAPESMKPHHLLVLERSVSLDGNYCFV
ncbi:MAG: hypothetical protein WBQ03_03500 [Candidatus Sulfotelmatobacter sp.]